ncbi:ubiquitin hydrolase [Pelomyxa schiedti]|nr:ubiquitin hydrolase [Pelomyxa schiedti]
MSGTTGDLNAVSAVGGEPVGEGVQSPPQPQNALPLTQPQQIPAQATQGQQSVPAQTEQVQQQQQQQKQGVGGEQTATATATTTAPASSPSPSLDEGEPEEEVFTKEDEEACLREYYEIEKSLKDGDLDYLKQFSAETLECTPKHLFMWRSIFPRTVLVVLKKRDPDEDDFEKIGNFFVEMLTAVCRFIELEVPEMMDLVVKIFTTRYPFYNDADPSDTEELLCRLGKVFRKNSGYRNLFRQMALSKTMPLTLFCTILKIIHKAPEDAVSDQLIKKLPEIVKKRIFQLTAEEVRTESKSTISIIIHRFQKILHKCDVEDADRFVDILLLEVARIYFKCPFLEKRLLGLSDIKDIIRRLSSEDKKHRSWITTQYMISWIKDQHIISTLFGNSKHLELIRRCGYIVRFLAQEQQLTLEEIQEIWNSCLGQHETVISAVYSLLEHIAYFLNEEAIQYIYSQFRAIPYSNYTTQAIHFLCDFCCETQDSRFGLDIIWDLVQDTSPVSTDLSLYICEKLGEILKALPLSNSQRIYYLGMLLDNIQNHLSIPQSLYLYRIILEGKHTSPEELTERVQLSISPFFADLPHWKETAQRLPPTSNVETVVSGTKYNLFYHVKERLDFIEFICKSKYQLDQPQIEIFWDTLVVGATNSQTRGVALEWVQSVYSLVPVRLMEFIFLEKFPLLDFSSLTKISFDTLCFLFSAINQQRGLLKRDKGHDANIILSPNLCGFDYLWRALFEASDENVAQTAITFLVRLVEKISLEANQAAQFRLNFVNNCMQKLSCTPIQKLHVERALIVFKRLLQQESRSYKRHALCTRGRLMLLDVKPTGLPPFALSVYQNETLQNLKKKVGEKLEVTPELVRVFNTYGKEFAPSSDSQTLQALCIHSGSLSVAKKEKDLKETPLRPPPPPPPKQEGMFSDVLCQTHFFETMFDLFSLNDDTISKMVWELLNILPTNPHLLEVISTLSEDVHKIMETQPVSKLLYSLTIVVSFTEPSEDPQEVDKRLRWQASFVKHGGITALLNILQSVDFQYGSNCRATLAMLLQIISFFLIDSEGNLRNNIIPVEPKSLQVLVYRLILESAMNSARGDFCSISDDGDVVENGMKLFVACVLHDKSTFTSTIMSQKDFDQWFASVLVEPRDMSIRCASCDGLYKICSGLKTEEVENMFTSKCLALLPSIPHNSKTCDFFFEFLNKLILDKCKAGQKPSNFVQQLLSWLDSHPMIEDKDLMQQDYFAPGLLKLLTTILSFSPEMKAPLGVTLIPTLFTKYLFDVPTINNHGPQRPPFFKSKSARFQAFASLVELCNQCPTNLSQILALLSPHHIHDDRRNFWNYYPSSNEISRCGFVGLKNQGATCYMNSLLQQLYMVPQFRNSILKAEIPALPSPSEKLEDNPLYHLQRIFGELQASERRSVDTKDFCASFKTNGSPINTHVQMDADEFFAQLCDKLEGLLKSANQATILQDCLGGVVCHQVVSRECSHVSQREEGFVTLSLVLQGKKNLEESLYSLIEGDLLDGDNKYHCESCGTKVAARKRCCLSQLPKTLVIHSKRFEFDLEQMRRIKLNDLYEFPMKLNLEPFTKEGLASREGTPTQAKPMSQCYDYELVGVLIHTGTADCGHYYSFIRERVSCNPNEEPRWFQFNDASVDEISPEVIPNSCFGGEEDTQVWDAKASQWVWKQVLKPNNAYMLFYSRVDVNHSDFPILPENIPSPIYTSVWEDNMRFFMERNIFDRDYFIFLWSLVRLIEKEPPELEFGESSTLSHSTLKLAAQFIFDTLSRARERGSFLEYSLNLGQLFEKHIPSCTWFMDYMLTDNMRWPKQILLECPCEDVRIPVVSLFITVIKHLNPHIHHLQWIYDTAVEPMNTDGVDSEKLLLSPPLPGVPKSLIIRFMDKLLSLACTFLIAPKRNYFPSFLQ